MLHGVSTSSTTEWKNSTTGGVEELTTEWRRKKATDMYGAVVLLVVAILVEVGATALLPRAQGFTEPGWSAVVLGGYAVSIWLLAVVVRTLPVSVAYAVWSGLGTAVVAVIAFLFLGEQMTLLKAASLAMIVAGVVGLNLAGAH
jgi:small multidrug resistance pump